MIEKKNEIKGVKIFILSYKFFLKVFLQGISVFKYNWNRIFRFEN